MTFSAVILAGGGSKRMGRDKSRLQIGGQSLLDRQLALARQLEPFEIFVSGRPDTDYSSAGCRVLQDLVLGCGPLSGIERALAVAASPLVLVVPVDLPYLSTSVIRKLLSRCAGGVGSISRVNGQIEPLVAFYPKAAHRIVGRLLQEGRYTARAFAEACLESELAIAFDVPAAEFPAFTNWNRLEDIAPSR